MSKLTKERLEEIASGQNTVSIPEAAVLARELLSLRTARDNEVDKLFVNAMHAIGVDESVNPEGCRSSQRSLEELHHLAITRGQQLREAREEIERLKESVDSRVPSLVARIATLTAERDEAEKKGREAGVAGMMQAMNAQCLTINQLEKQIAALKSCPAMEEVDNLRFNINDVQLPPEERIKAALEACDLARRSISSREEVVGLLVNLWAFERVRDVVNSVSDYPPFTRIRDIVEGK